MPRYDETTLDRFADDVRRDSVCVLPAHFPLAAIEAWAAAFAPLLQRHVMQNEKEQNRGTQRYYVTLPFQGVFADERIVFDSDIVAICARLVGATW